MDDEKNSDDERDETHFWVDCPGCGYGGKIGLPLDYPADVVVCPNCRQVVRVRPEDRVLWRPADPTEFLRSRFPSVDWSAGDATEPTSRTGKQEAPPVDKSPAAPGPVRSARTWARREREAKAPSRRGTGASALDNHFVQAGLMLAGFVLPLAITLLLTQPERIEGNKLIVAEPPGTPIPDVKAREVPIPPTPLCRNASPPDAQTTNKASPTKPRAKRTTADVVYRRGRQRLSKGDYTGAICDFDDVLRNKPDFVWCFFYRAGAFSLMGNQAMALDDLNQAIRAMPTEARVWRGRSVVHERMRDFAAAAADIWHALELAEDGVGTDAALAKAIRRKADHILDELHEHATAALRSHDYATAITEFSEVMRHEPDSASAWLRRAVSYDLDGQFDKALDDLNVALRLRPGPAEAFKFRSVLHERKQNYAAALADIRTAKRLDPCHAEYGERIRWLLRQQEVQHSEQVAARWRMR